MDVDEPISPRKSTPAAAASVKTAVARESGAFELPWVEKYRPLVLDDVVGNEEAIARLRVIAQHGNMPNIILSGPPGTGKTTSIMCLARQMLGAAVKDAVLELNASDERGIDVVRNKIKMFAQKKVTLPVGRHKIVILDEADSMTSGAQQALRRIMEMFSSTTRFALACNTSSQVIEPIQSRCAILRFTKLSDKQITKRLMEVLQAEKISSWTEQGLEAVVFTAQGDMRYALNNLQATHAGLGNITQENVFKVVDQPHPVTVRLVVESCVKGDIHSALTPLQDLYRQGYSPVDIVQTLFRVIKHFEMPDKLKLEFIRETGFAHMRIADGVDTLLQLTGLAGRLCVLATKK